MFKRLETKIDETEKDERLSIDIRLRYNFQNPVCNPNVKRSYNNYFIFFQGKILEKIKYKPKKRLSIDTR